jgi:hypothetical protein
VRIDLRFSRVCLFALIFFASYQKCRGQDGLIEYLDNSVVAVAVIQKPRAIVEYLSNLGFAEDARWQHAIEIATSETGGFLGPGELKQCAVKCNLLLQLFETSKEIGIIWHHSENKLAYEFTLAIRCLSERKQETAETLQCVKEFVSPGMPPAFADFNVKVCNRSDWVLLSNSTAADELTMKLNSEKIPARVLTNSRRFRRVFGDDFETQSDQPVVFVYGDPERLSHHFFYSELSPELRTAYKFSEVAGLGISLKFETLTAKDSVRSAVIEVKAPCTLPRTGIGALVDSYQPIGEIPQIPMEFVELNASAYDPLKKHAMLREIHDAANGQGSYDAECQNRWDRRGLNYVNDVLMKSDKVFNFRYHDPATDRLTFLLFEHVIDNEAALRYLKKITNYPSNDPEKPVYKSRKGKSGDLFESSHPDVPTYFLGQDWYVCGLRKKHVVAVDELLDGNPKQTSNSLKAIEKHQTYFGRKGQAFRIQFLNVARLDGSSEIENKRIAEKVGYSGFARNTKSGPGWEKYKAYQRKDPDKFGLRIDIEDKDDSLAAFKCLVISTITTQLGNLVLSYHNEDSGIRIFGALFAEDAKR